MKLKIYAALIAFSALCPFLTIAQECDIQNRVQPNGTMLYFLNPQKFYQTKTKSLHGAIATDGERYFLILSPKPVPPKDTIKKISGDLEVLLENGSKQSLEHFDSYFIEKDTALALFFIIKKDQLDLFSQNQVEQVQLDVGGPKRELYTFMLHKEALKEQLSCFLDRTPKRK